MQVIQNETDYSYSREISTPACVISGSYKCRVEGCNKRFVVKSIQGVPDSYEVSQHLGCGLEIPGGGYYNPVTDTVICDTCAYLRNINCGLLWL